MNADSKMIAMMDEVGVDMAQTCPVDYGLALGESDMDMWEINACYPELMARWPGRFIYHAGVDPRREYAARLFEKALVEWGARGLKLMPAAGFLPNDPICYPLYDLAVKWDVPVLFHAGPNPLMKSRMGHPFYFDDLASDYPDLKIILGHVAGDWWRDAKLVIRTKRNCYGEIAGWQRRHQEDPAQFFKDLGELRDGVGADHIMYGTDAPAVAGIPLKPFADALRNLPTEAAKYGVTFTVEETEQIMGLNMARLCGITVPSSAR